MKIKHIDIANLKLLGGFSKRNQTEIAQAIELFKARKIERFDTARNFINELPPKGTSQGQRTVLQRRVSVKE